MKALKILAALMLVGSFSLGMADETVDEQIIAIQNATTDEERVELVNEFKEIMSTLSDEERTAAIDELRTTMSADGEALHTQTQTQTHQRSRINQTDEAQMLEATQVMSEGLSASQAMQGTPNENTGSFGGHRGSR